MIELSVYNLVEPGKELFIVFLKIAQIAHWVVGSQPVKNTHGASNLLGVVPFEMRDDKVNEVLSP